MCRAFLTAATVLFLATSLLAEAPAKQAPPPLLDEETEVAVRAYMAELELATAQEIDKLKKLVATTNQRIRDELSTLKTTQEKQQKAKEIREQSVQWKARIDKLEAGEEFVMLPMYRGNSPKQVGCIGQINELPNYDIDPRTRMPRSVGMAWVPIQVIDNRSAIIECRYTTAVTWTLNQRRGGDERRLGPHWLQNYDTSNWVDTGRVYWLNECFIFTGTKTYKTVGGGTSTILVIEPFDIEAAIKAVKAKDQAKEQAGQEQKNGN